VTTPHNQPGRRTSDPLATLFDIRSFIGSLFVIFGIIVTIVGLTATDADIAKAAGVNLSLILGPVMLAFGVGFIVWVLVSPPEIAQSHEMTEEELPEQLRHLGLEAIPEHPGESTRPSPHQTRKRPTGH
jgi:hypothetical protein